MSKPISYGKPTREEYDADYATIDEIEATQGATDDTKRACQIARKWLIRCEGHHRRKEPA